MRSLSKLFVTGGLVIMTGPLCLLAHGQGYVDVEAERAAAAAAGKTATTAPADPYGAQPAQAYPATSYGVNSAPAAPAAVAPTVSSGSSQAGGQNLGSLFSQIQQLQQEVMRLNGKVEEQAHEIRVLKEQSMQRYVDLDKRLSESPAGSAATAGGSSDTRTAPAVDDTPPAVSTGSSGAKEQPGELEAYRAAYALVQGREFDRAIPAFQQFQRDYPDGKYAANAYYWLGELYLVKDPPDLESSRQAFAMLISQYPDNSKAADALYKLGKVQFMKGNREKAREYLDLVIRQYSSSNSTVANLARDFIAENY